MHGAPYACMHACFLIPLLVLSLCYFTSIAISLSLLLLLLLLHAGAVAVAILRKSACRHVVPFAVEAIITLVLMVQAQRHTSLQGTRPCL